MKTNRIFALAPLAALLIWPVTAPASASTPNASPPAAGVVIDVPDLFRLDRQEEGAGVTFRGVSNQTVVRVNWGDGSPAVSQKGPCSVAAASKNKTGCRVFLPHTFTTAGDYVIRATSRRLNATKAVTVAAPPVAWTRPAGWVQPAGWAAGIGATFTPCQNVGWYFDHTGEPADRVAMRGDVAAVLAVLGSETGLTFREVAADSEAQLHFGWKDLQGMGVGFATQGDGDGRVVFATDDPYTLDRLQGLNMLRLAYSDETGVHEVDVPGRGWLVMKLTMIALGLMPVDDRGQAMYSGYVGPGALGAGDLDGLHTMYKNLPCPAIPD